MVSKNKVIGNFAMKGVNSLCHYKWRYKYHTLFVAKYRR